MAKGYWIVSVDVSNPESYKMYIAENRSAFRKYGARFLIRGGKSEVVEGKGRSRIVSSLHKRPTTYCRAGRQSFYIGQSWPTAYAAGRVADRADRWRFCSERIEAVLSAHSNFKGGLTYQFPVADASFDAWKKMFEQASRDIECVCRLLEGRKHISVPVTTPVRWPSQLNGNHLTNMTATG
jgi:Domain of unknown function (DUF1330)